MRHALTIAIASLLGACQPTAQTPTEEGEGAGSPPSSRTVAASPTGAYDGIAANETVHFTGTEPFWGGEIEAGKARYSTPENIDGTSFPVTRFAGNNGVTYSGTMEGTKFDLMLTPGECSDGMSTRAYPFTATLAIGAEQRNGCAWTDEQGFTGPKHP